MKPKSTKTVNNDNALCRRLYAIRDCKVNEFNSPTVFPSDASAIRAFGDLITRDKDTLLANHPSDFALYYLGEFHYVLGYLIQDNPLLLANGSDFVKE